MRTEITNKRDLVSYKQLIKDTKYSKIHYNGMKFNSCLNKLNYYNTVNGLPPEIMHDMLEGAIIKNFNILMLTLNDHKLYKITNLKSDMENFK